jgi:hypothetical protein
MNYDTRFDPITHEEYLAVEARRASAFRTSIAARAGCISVPENFACLGEPPRQSVGPDVDSARHGVCSGMRYLRPTAEEPTMTADQSTIQDWLRLIQAEYLEMPGLNLTKPQVQRLWRLEPEMCDALLDSLVATEFLKKTDRDAYVLAQTLD